jgi:hypothetical protein
MGRRKINSLQLNDQPDAQPKDDIAEVIFSQYVPRCQDPDVVQDECKLLDKLLAGFNIQSDAALAAWLEIDKSAIYGVRSGKHRLGFIQKLKVLDRMGFLKGRSLIESILPQTLADYLAYINQTLVSSHAEAQLARSNSPSPDSRILELAKSIMGFSTDIPLARLLHIKANTISMIRSGRSVMGPEPRLRILGSIDPTVDVESILRVAKSNDLLRNAIDRWIISGQTDGT